MGNNTCKVCGGETVDDKFSRLCLCYLTNKLIGTI